MTKQIVLAGGCFWGLEDLFRERLGVVDTTVGYTGGEIPEPTYENHRGHAEALRIEYDPEQTSYRELLDFFFTVHDPTTVNRQGNDVGASYRSAIFYADEREMREAQEFIDLVNASGRWKDPVATTLEPLSEFYEAEEYHQDYLEKNPRGYTCHYQRFGSYLGESPKAGENRPGRVEIWPRSVFGWVSVGGLGVFVVSVAVFLVFIRLGERGGMGFFSNLKLALPALLASSGGLAGLVFGLFGIARRRETAVLVVLSVLVGFVVSYFVLGEIVTPH